jgi:NAD(P)-dependent dehydrogenase (short-subunit alcohol dehydrogenase family)
MPEGAVALITGAASGIGAATAARFAVDGARALVLIDRHAARLEEMAGALGGSEKMLVARDVADEAGWLLTQGEVKERYGALDVAIVNAGVSDAGAIVDLDFNAWRRVLSANLDGAFLTLRCAMRLMAPEGSIVLVSSASAVKAEPGTAAYGASKAGMTQLMRVAAKECAPRRIRVNAVLPGGVETPMWSEMPFFADLVRTHGSERAAFDAIAAEGTPLGRYAKADDIAAQIAFLCSPAAAAITGAALMADGGYTL